MLGIPSERIIFTKYLNSMGGEHLKRYGLADLFLDTLPFNAHTTAVDTLKAGVPTLTLPGKSFASRVGSSLLTAVNLPELISPNQESYEALAIELAHHPDKLAEIKQKLIRKLLNAPLFDTPLFTTHRELACEQMYQRYQNDLLPDYIAIN